MANGCIGVRLDERLSFVGLAVVSDDDGDDADVVGVGNVFDDAVEEEDGEVVVVLWEEEEEGLPVVDELVTAAAATAAATAAAAGDGGGGTEGRASGAGAGAPGR